DEGPHPLADAGERTLDAVSELLPEQREELAEVLAHALEPPEQRIERFADALGGAEERSLELVGGHVGRFARAEQTILDEPERIPERAPGIAQRLDDLGRGARAEHRIDDVADDALFALEKADDVVEQEKRQDEPE